MTENENQRLTSRKKKFLEYLRQHEEGCMRATNRFLAEFLNCSERTVRRMTKMLEQTGVIEKTQPGSSQMDRTVHYRLIDADKPYDADKQERCGKSLFRDAVKTRARANNNIIINKNNNYNT
jgi:DNA-binding Lrp family transcriptional regulator